MRLLGGWSESPGSSVQLMVQLFCPSGILVITNVELLRVVTEVFVWLTTLLRRMEQETLVSKSSVTLNVNVWFSLLVLNPLIGATSVMLGAVFPTMKNPVLSVLLFCSVSLANHVMLYLPVSGVVDMLKK